ncbi:MAG: S41 family peptidase [Ignavibacteria bacterium]|nr:S41 family peptidase [Ignavibacteria bacterium]
MKSRFILITLLFFSFFTFAQEARLLRFPTIHSNQIVFSYAGDLYTVSSSGGTARKLTNDEGYEMFARFSPDGKWIAFTGQYDGNTEVYVIPSEGGIPKRLSYTATLDRDDVSDRMGPNNIVIGWRDNENILLRSRWRDFNSFIGQLYLQPLNGGMLEQLPLPRGGFSSYSPDKKKLAYNRVFREFRTWKRYRGGQADDVWIYDFETKKIEDVTNNPAQDIIPMWSGNKIYFISDRDSRMNLFVYNLDTKETTKLTDFTDFDIKFPSLGDNAIVFEIGGYIYKMDLATEKAEKVTININEDFVSGRGGLRDVSKDVSNYEISPDGNRALFGARGEVFTVPLKNGNTRNLTNTSGVHERNSKWSPDGKWIAYISDATGEDEIYIVAQDGKPASPSGRSEPIQITKNGDNYKYQIFWSPDSKKLLWGDKMQRLQYVDIDSKDITLVDHATAWEIRIYCWSPDSKWIAYSRPEEDVMTKIYIYSLDKKEKYEVTDGWYSSSAPEFSDDGKYLFFESNRSFSPKYGWTEWNHIYTDMSKIYLVTLSMETKSPFEPKSDEVKINGEDKDKEDKKEDDKKDSKEVIVKVDTDGLVNRILELPVSSSNYSSITSAGDKIYYMRSGSADENAKLFLFELDKQKETELGEIDGYEISYDNKKMLVGHKGSYAIIDLPLNKVELKEKLDLKGMKVNLDRYTEWEQIFNESWRQMRDFFYAPNMHGVDWAKIKATYQPLLKYVNHRADLTYIIGEMIGELNAGHSYVGGGDYPKAEKIKLGLLGAELVKDESGYFKIIKILKSQNWDKNVRNPLTDIGVNVKEGDYIIAVDRISTIEMENIYSSLVDKADKQVTLLINSSPDESGAKENVVIPIDDEQPLYYYTWVQNNIDKVNKATDGKVGYLHIPDMGPGGLNEFVKYYYPQLKKEALIIDVRGNGGGNVSPQIIERLRREIVLIDVARNSATNYNPGGMHVGPKVCLLNEFSASDGDIFPYRFKHYKLGKLIGKRSWGGVVGIRGTNPFVDGGFLNRPEFSRYDVEGKEWVMEGHGVEPDIYVDNDPSMEFEGIDQQLNKAIEVALEELEKNPVKHPVAPPYPIKNK